MYVSHDEDGYWQFLCGKEHKQEEARIVSLATILNMDETIGDLANLDYGMCAVFYSPIKNWIIKRI